MDEFRHVGRHSEDLADGRVVSPGESVELSAEDQRDPHNKRLLDEGILDSTRAEKTGRQKSDNNGNGGGDS